MQDESSRFHDGIIICGENEKREIWNRARKNGYSDKTRKRI
jgi:hypothetical protein